MKIPYGFVALFAVLVPLHVSAEEADVMDSSQPSSVAAAPEAPSDDAVASPEKLIEQAPTAAGVQARFQSPTDDDPVPLDAYNSRPWPEQE